MIYKLFLGTLFLLISLHSSAQFKFKEGYIVNNRHERTDCLIRNIGNEESTMHYEYRLKDAEEIHKIELSKVEEFGIEDELKCIRALISIDVSRDRIKTMKDTVRQWDEGHAFLKVLIEGELASLYEYYDLSKPHYFYRLNDGDIIPLTYKKYHVEIEANFVEQILYDHTFRDQLHEELSCGSQNKSDRLSYTKKDLVKYFRDYYKCNNSTYASYSTQIKKGILSVKPAVSINTIQLGIQDPIDAAPKAYFDKVSNVGFGVETEYIFPYNRYKWGVFGEANYLSYKTDNVLVGDETDPLIYRGYTIDYQSIELPIGVSYYMNMDQNNRLFLKAAYVPFIILSDSYIAFSDSHRSDFSNSSRLFFGVGYNFHNIAVEFKYYTPTNVTQNIYKRGSDLSQISFKLSYAFRIVGSRGVQ